MLRRVARPRVLLFLTLFALAGFWSAEWQPAAGPPTGVTPPAPASTRAAIDSVDSSVANFPDPAVAAAAKAAATGALAAEQSSQQVGLALSKEPTRPSSAISTAPTATTIDSPNCAWPADVQVLNADVAQSSCRPFVGLLVPCTSARTCDRSGKCWENIDDTSLLKELVPSVFNTLAGCTCDCQRSDCRPNKDSRSLPTRSLYDLVVYIGYDAGDAIYDTDAARDQLPQRFKAALQASTVGGFGVAQELPRIGLQLVRCKDSRSMVANSNCLSSAAHHDGAEYTYRVNDDTVFEKPGWLESLPGALQSLDPPNIGVAGPRASGGNWKILTYDMVHRTHMDIFGGTRYPPSLQNWYSDDWITKVYSGDHSTGARNPAQDCMRKPGAACLDFKQGRMVMLSGISVQHTRTVDHTRYTPDHSGKEALPQLLDEGQQMLADYLSELKQQGTNSKAASDSGARFKSAGATKSGTDDTNIEDGAAKTSQIPDGVKNQQERSRSAATASSNSPGKIEKSPDETDTSAPSKTAAAIAAFGDCPDGKWELRGAQIVCPSAEAAAAGTPSSVAAAAGDTEDAIGAADERLSTRLDPNRMQSVCQLPMDRIKRLTPKQHGRLRSDWCNTTATYRRQLPSGGTSLTATLQSQAKGVNPDRLAGNGAVIHARCNTGELRWTDQGHNDQYRTTSGMTWHTLSRGQELVLPFSGSLEYVEVACTLPHKSKQSMAGGGSEENAWATREVFTRFAPAPERQIAPELVTSVSGSPVGPDGLNIVTLIIDSLSRAQAMAFLPELRRLLQETAPQNTEVAAESDHSSTHYSYVFDHAGVVGAHSGTNSNMGALFAGQKYNFARDDAARVATLVTPWSGTSMLWDDLAKQGYVTAAAFPFGDLWGAAYWNSTFHHLAPAKFGWRGSSYKDHDPVLASWDERGEPICVGRQLSSDLDTVWMKGFLQAYPARKKFLYAHFMEGHNAPEATAQLDANLVRLVRAAMALPHTAVYVASDHGGVPRDLPLSALFLPQDFLRQHADVATALQANQHQYTTHYDMHITLRHLSRWPELPPREASLPKAAASLLGPLGVRRDCRADIGDGHCICRQWTTCIIGCTRSAERQAAEDSTQVGKAEAEVLERPDSEAGSAAAKLTVRRARQTAEKVLRHFNQQLLDRATNKINGDDVTAPSSCRQLSLGSLTHVRTQQLSEGGAGELVYVEFSVKESTYSRFFASAFFGPGPAAAARTGKTDASMTEAEIQSSGQLTTYQPFRDCADPRLPLPFCVCKDV